MTDYVMAYEGKGSHWGVGDAIRLADKLRTEATVTDGVIRWNSNNRVPPEDCVALAVHIGLPVDLGATNAARMKETSDFLADYRRQEVTRVRTPEEMFEMRAAFGSGATVVNLITTGGKIKL